MTEVILLLGLEITLIMESGCSSVFHMMRMVMKMAAVSAISLLLLCCSAISSSDSQEVCDHRAAKGDNFTVPLLTTLEASDSLRWTYNSNLLILYRRGSNFIVGKKEEVTGNGSLKLRNVSTNAAGSYTPEVYDKDGRAQGKLKSIRLCVLDRVPVPSLSILCSSTSVKFTCKVAQTEDLKYEWHQNDKVLEKEKGPTLTRVAKEVETDSFTCKVSNAVSSMSTLPATQKCYKASSGFPDTLFGINTWIIVGAGGGVVLVLIITVIVCCICNKRRKRMQLKDEGELRLAWTNNQDQHQHDHPPEHHHHHHHHHQQNHPPDHRHHQHHRQQQPAGHTGPRQQRSKQQREQQRPRVPDPPGGHPHPSPRRPAQVPRLVDQMGEEQPPPLPQPRKKAGKAPRV